MRVQRYDLILVVFHSDDLLDSRRARAHHHEVLPFYSHDVFHLVVINSRSKKKKNRFFLLFLGFSFQSFLLELVARARERERKRGARKRKFCVVETLKKALSFSLAWRLIAAAST